MGKLHDEKDLLEQHPNQSVEALAWQTTAPPSYTPSPSSWIILEAQDLPISRSSQNGKATQEESPPMYSQEDPQKDVPIALLDSSHTLALPALSSTSEISPDTSWEA